MLQNISDYLDILSKIVVLLGLPLAYIQYRITKRREKREREYGTYNALDEKFMEFQKMCLNYPYLDIFDIPDINPISLNPEQKKQELIIYTMLFSIFERAYLLYSDQSNIIKKRQWTGWENYIISFCRRENFLAAWKISGETFDSNYEIYMQTTIKNIMNNDNRNNSFEKLN